MEQNSFYENLKHPKQIDIRIASGEYNSSDLMVALLYRIMRDELPAGVVEGIVQDILSKPERVHICFTNGWLAQYANNIVQRLTEHQESI